MSDASWAWVKSYSELRTPAALERMMTVIRGAEAMGLYWKVWRADARLHYIVGPSQDAVLGVTEVEALDREPLPVLEGL